MGLDLVPIMAFRFSNAVVLNEYTENEGLLITGPNSITFTSGSGSIMDVAAGFSDGFSFNYSSPYYAGVVSVYDGLDGTGNLLASITLPLTQDGSGTPGCGGHNYCPDIAAGVDFSGIAKSVNFSGTANYIVYDDITLGSSTPITSAAPEPSTWALMFGGLGLLGGGLRLRRARREENDGENFVAA